MLWQDGGLHPGQVSSEIEDLLVDVITVRAIDCVRPGHILTALLDQLDQECRTVLTGALKQGVRPEELAPTIEAYCSHGGDGANLTGMREDFSAEALAALDDLETMLDGGGDGLPAATLGELALAHLWFAVVRHPDEDDRKWLSELLDFDEAEARFKRLISPGKPRPLFDPSTGQMLLDYYCEGVITALEEGAQTAGEMGFGRLMPAHLFLALLTQPESPTEWAVRLEALEGRGPGDVVTEIRRHLLAGREPVGAAITLDRDRVAEGTQRALRAALRSTSIQGREVVSQWDVAMAVADGGDERLRAILGSAGIGIDLDVIVDRLRQYREQGLEEREPSPFSIPPEIGCSEDLTYMARQDELSEALNVDDVIERICRGLYRSEANHVLIVGEAGIGKTAVVRELARRAAAGDIGFLARKRFVLIDAGDVPPDEAKTRLVELIALLKGRNDIIPCISGLDALLASDDRGNSGRPVLRAALRGGGLQMIAIMTRTFFAEYLANDPQELKQFSIVEMDEPEEEAALAMLAQVREDLEEEYDLSIMSGAVERAVRLASDCILSERLPAKAVRVLRASCDAVAYEREQAADPDGNEERTDWRVTAETVIATVSEETGIPASTLRGSAEETNYQALLENFVVGQPDAVGAVAQELRMIKQGFKNPAQPASVMLFVGLTGTGKTELAKAIATVYSTSKSLQTYTMGNFSEAHSVSNLIGVPPGYVGYEQGGRLINQLNADPYSVLLFDEIDKAHPEVWRPMLNLLDEGWIVDRRNVKAWGTRAVLVLTSNAGAERIARMMEQGLPLVEIEQEARTYLASLVDKDRTPRFPPEFLARIGCVVFFRPLTEKAMCGIVELKLGDQAKRFGKVRAITLTWAPEVVQLIASVSHGVNKQSGGREGGRIVNKNIDGMIVAPIMDLMEKRPDEFDRARTLHVSVVDGTVSLELQEIGERSVAEIAEECVGRLRETAAGAEIAARDVLDKLDAVLRAWRDEVLERAGEGEREKLAAVADSVLSQLREQRQQVQQTSSEAEAAVGSLVEKLAREVERVAAGERREEIG